MGNLSNWSTHNTDAAQPVAPAVRAALKHGPTGRSRVGHDATAGNLAHEPYEWKANKQHKFEQKACNLALDTGLWDETSDDEWCGMRRATMSGAGC